MTSFPFSYQPSATPPRHPAAADAVVIGGGIIGICTALFLAEAGKSVVVLDKGRIAGEQSSRNWGWIRQQGRDQAELPIMQEAMTHWAAFAGLTNRDMGLRPGGVTYLAKTSKEMDGFEAWMPHAQAHGIDSQMLSKAQTAQTFPQMSNPCIGAMHTPSDMRAEPWVAVPIMAEIAAAKGAALIEGCAARILDIANGAITGVFTEQGRIESSQVVVAGGAWSSLFLRRHGIDIPQLSVRETVVATKPLPEVSAGAAADDVIAFRRRVDGGYTLAPAGAPELYVGPDAFRSVSKYAAQLKANPLGQMLWPAAPRGFPDAWGTKRTWDADEETPFERMRVLNPAPNRRKAKKLLRDFGKLFPNLPRIEAQAQWAGMIDTMPDIVPVLDHGPVSGLVIGTGLSGHGFGIGPGVGRVLSALVMGVPVGHDLNRFRLSRFTDGSTMQPGGSL